MHQRHILVRSRLAALLGRPAPANVWECNPKENRSHRGNIKVDDSKARTLQDEVFRSLSRMQTAL